MRSRGASRKARCRPAGAARGWSAREAGGARGDAGWARRAASGASGAAGGTYGATARGGGRGGCGEEEAGPDKGASCGWGGRGACAERQGSGACERAEFPAHLPMRLRKKGVASNCLCLDCLLLRIEINAVLKRFPVRLNL